MYIHIFSKDWITAQRFYLRFCILTALKSFPCTLVQLFSFNISLILKKISGSVLLLCFFLYKTFPFKSPPVSLFRAPSVPLSRSACKVFIFAILLLFFHCLIFKVRFWLLSLVSKLFPPPAPLRFFDPLRLLTPFWALDYLIKLLSLCQPLFFKKFLKRKNSKKCKNCKSYVWKNWENSASKTF